MRNTLQTAPAATRREPRGLMRDQRGFTMIEMMVVVAIIGIAAGFATVSHLSQLPHKRLMGAARTLVADLKSARSFAVRENQPVVVCFDKANSTYQLARVTNPASDTCGDPGVNVFLTEDIATQYPGVTMTVGLTGGSCPGGGATPVNFNNSRAAFNGLGSSVTAPNGNVLFNQGSVYLTNWDGKVPETVCIRVVGAVGTVRAFKWGSNGWT